MAGWGHPSALLLAGVEIKQECRTLTKSAEATALMIAQLEYLIFLDSLERFGYANPRGLFTE
jgi:hypothetical protein